LRTKLKNQVFFDILNLVSVKHNNIDPHKKVINGQDSDKNQPEPNKYKDLLVEKVDG
jgi:hypothetical protein